MLIAVWSAMGGSRSATVAASTAPMLGQTLAGGIPVPTLQDCTAELYTPNPIVRSAEHIPTLPAATRQHHRTHLDNLTQHEVVDHLAQDLGACDISRTDASDSSPKYPPIPPRGHHTPTTEGQPMTPQHPTPPPAAPKQPVVKATVWHKTDDNTMFQPYEAGHRVQPVFEFELGRDEWLHLTRSQAPDAAALEFAENAFAAFTHHPPQGWQARSRAYYTAGNRSLSVGDLVVIGEVAWAVERFGFRAVSLPSGSFPERRLDRLKAAATHDPPAASA